MILSTPQLIGLLAGILGIAGLAIWSGTRPQSYGNVNGTPIIAGIIMGTLAGGSSTVGTAQLAYNYGLSAWWFTLGGGLACLLLALVFSKPWRRSGCMTLIGIIGKEFGPAADMAASLLSSVGTFINILSQLISGTAVIAVIAPTLGLVPALIITAAFMALYVVFGGTQGAGIVGILKLALLYISMIGCGIMVLILCGGFEGFTGLVAAIENPEGVNFFSLFARGIGKDAGAALSLILGVLTTQTYAQAVMSGKSDAASRRGALISAFMIPPIGAGGILVGLYMRAVHPGIVAKTALTAFATEYLPPVLSGLLLGTLFIAVVGTGAGLATGISTIVRRDILQRFSDRLGDAKVNKTLSRVIIVLILALAVVLSAGSLGDTILSFAFMSMGLRGAVVFVPMLCALWLPGKVNKAWAVAGIILGPLTVLICGTVLPLPGGIDPLFAGVAAALVCCGVGLAIGRRDAAIKPLHHAQPTGHESFIALDSESYSGVDELSEALSAAMGIPCRTNELIPLAAELSGIPEHVLRRYEERSVMAAYDLGAEDEANMRLPSTRELAAAQLEACRRLAAEGPCILADHFAGKAADELGGVRVFLHADAEVRASTLAKAKDLGPAAARRQLKRLDRSRSRFYRSEDTGWGMARTYTLSVNTSGKEPADLADGLAAYLHGEKAAGKRAVG